MDEAGLQQLVTGNGTALLAPKGTPATAVATLKHQMGEICADAQFDAALRSQGIEPLHQEPAGAYRGGRRRSTQT